MKFSKKEIFSVPNILCYFRILLVPVFIYVYFVVETGDSHLISALVLFISSMSDFLDGFIARKFNMITELGKLIDPIADKLTQFVVACVLMYTYPAYIWLVIIIVLKDGMLLFAGWYILKKTGRHLSQAEFPGKIATAVFFVVSTSLIIFTVPSYVAASMIYATTILMAIAMGYYGQGLYRLYEKA